MAEGNFGLAARGGRGSEACHGNLERTFTGIQIKRRKDISHVIIMGEA